MEKNELRLYAKKYLSTLTHQQRLELSNLLSLNLLLFFKDLPLSKNLIGAYAPMKDEPVWNRAFGENVNFKESYPVINKNRMDFHLCSFSDLVEEKTFGVNIMTPPKGTKKIVPEVLFVPGLSFNSRGERLGRGRGCYDGYLKDFKGISVGICFEDLVREKIPTEVHDENVDFVITNKNIYSRN